MAGPCPAVAPHHTLCLSFPHLSSRNRPVALLGGEAASVAALGGSGSGITEASSQNLVITVLSSAGASDVSQGQQKSLPPRGRRGGCLPGFVGAVTKQHPQYSH